MKEGLKYESIILHHLEKSFRAAKKQHFKKLIPSDRRAYKKVSNC